MSEFGHNSGDVDPEVAKLLGDEEAAGLNLSAEKAQNHLRSIVSRLMNLEDEIKALRGDAKDIMQEAKSAGFDKRGITEIMKMKKMSAQEFEEREQIRDLYLGNYRDS